MKIIEGKLEPFFETGTEGIIWSVYEDGKFGYEGLNCLDYGDYLRIYDSYKKETILWEGNINYDWEINYRPYPMNPKYGQQEVLGYWVHGIQKEVEPETWGKWFFNGLTAQLIKSDLGKFFPIKDIEIKAHAFTGQLNILGTGKPGDLTLLFKDESYIKFKNLSSELYTEFYASDNKYDYFNKYIKGNFKEEQLMPFKPF